MFKEGLCNPGKQTGSHKNCFPFSKMAEKHGGVPKHCKAVFCQEWYFLSRISCLRRSNKCMFFLTREIKSLKSPFNIWTSG